MITEQVKAAIIAAINDGKMNDTEPLTLDSFLVFRMRSEAHKKATGFRPAGNFEHEGEDYAVYFNSTQPQS